MTGSRVAWLVAGALLAVCAVARADVYKWVDARGVTTYGNKPPPGARGLTRLGPADDRLSIIPLPVPRGEIAAPLVQFDDVPRGSVDRAAAAPAENAASRREQCFAERRVDCGAPTPATFDAVPSYGPWGGWPSTLAR
jgi:hypothetical protein